MGKTLTPPHRAWPGWAALPLPPEAPAAATSADAAERYAAWERAAAWPDVPAEVPLARFDRLRAALAVTQEVLAAAAGLNPRTLQRRRREGGALTGREAGALVRLERLFGLAVHVFGSEAAAAAWFAGPVPILGEPPIEAARTERGARAAEQVLGALEFGFAA